MPYTLAFADRFRRVLESVIESDTSDSVAFASIPELPTKLVTYWTNTQYKKLLSCVMTGADLMWPDEADEIIWQLIKVVHQPITLEDEDEDGCINYLPYAPFISYEPQNPYNEPDLVPDDYLVPPFFVNSGFEYPESFGYKATDVFIAPASINIDPIDLLTLNLPNIKLRLRGSGQIEVDFLNVAFGGMVIVKIGGYPNLADIILDGVIETGVSIIDLNNDALSIPPEQNILISREWNIVAEPTEITEVFFVFVPVLDDALIPIRLGGGLRQIGLCGFESEDASMYVEDIRFDPTLRLQKRVMGEWSDVSGAESFENFILAVQTIANRASNGVQQILTMSIDPTHPDYTWLGSVHQMYLSAVQQDAAIARIVAESLRDATDIGTSLPDAGFVGSALQDYIDAIEFNPSSLEASIAAAAAAAAAAQDTADAAQASADSANMAIAAIEADIDSLDARLDVLEALQITTQHWDFKADNFDFAEAFPATWTPSVGFEFSDDLVLDKASSGFADGRLMAYRLELRRIDSGEANYTSEIVGDVASYGKLESGLNIQFHKVGNMTTQQDLELELTCDTGDYVLEGLTIYFYGATMAYDD